ncbi:Hypothetical protein PEIBARAKI_5212 [Petrimonas sp. IBARAKI]|nr:Hypothetical protein PEIBARAKI_5212 [Petrimonas sp. IBARAKI]
MRKKSTTEKGDSFEKKVFNIIKDLLENDEFYVSGKNSKIFWKKKYPSSKTETDIEVDISIETYQKGAEKYSLLTIIECKDYKSSIPVNDIRELGSVLNEIGEHNTKGILISKSPFQKATLGFARNTKIAIGRLNLENEIDWINHRKDKKQTNIESEVIDESLTNDILTTTNFIAQFENKGYNRLPDLLLNFGIIDNFYNIPKYINIPFRSSEYIEITINELFDYSFYENSCLDIEKVSNRVKDIYNAKFYLDKDLPNSILGKIEFNPIKIHISNSLKSDINRFRFTFAHEIGHLVLHNEILRQYLDTKTDKDESISLFQSDSFSNNKRLEIQANMFASSMLMPKHHLERYVKEYFKKENINKGYLYLDNQPVNQRLVFSFLSELQVVFGVSKEVAKYRLIGLNFLQDTTNISIGHIMRNIQKPSG